MDRLEKNFVNCLTFFKLFRINLKQKDMKNKKKSVNQKTILKGEGINQHTLYGNFSAEENHTFFSEIVVKEETELRHEQPNGSFAEHNTLKVDEGKWVMGKQVEYNPFKQSISQVWD